MDTWKDFIAILMQIDFLKLARDEAIKEWGLDIPATLLFSILGKAIAEKFDELSLDDRNFIFDTVETGMGTSDTALKTFIATGTLEALFSKASSDTALWNRIDAQLGDVSRNYLIEWGRLFQS